MDKKIVKGKDVFIFDDEGEFRMYHLGADFLPWRDESVKVGSWVQTDSGGITKCLDVFKLKKNRCVTTICGTYVVDYPQKMDNTIRSKHFRFVSEDGTQKTPHEAKLNEKDKAFARLMMLGGDRIEAYKKVHPRAKSELYIKQKISTIINKQGYDSFMSDEFTKLLSESGITKQWGIDRLKEIVEDSKSPAGVKKEIIDDLLDDLGESRKQQKTTKEIHSWHASSQIGEGELKEVKKIGEKVEKELPLEKNNETP